ncbi:pyruvate synthase subunit PorA [archaeon BMS3Abin16]|nr:pyruvate synthase subunit PorA [archaeon BMS3Abin16]HDY73961.1 pyruvate ferredoxin oxidoreductase [Euryarchaeota archaeon]
MASWDIMHGSRAVAEAVRLADVDVIAAYPITPQTHIVEDTAKMVADGDIRAEYVKVESEHSAMSVVIAASGTGARTFTATASQGLALMWEMLFVASGMRLPVVMVNANRALSAPISIWNDQQDSIASRDVGWIQLYVETNQEALDTTLMAYRIAEDAGVQLPVMVCMDGFVLTHTVEPVEVPDEEQVSKFLPKFKPQQYLDPKDPMALGPIAFPNVYTELRAMQQQAMDGAMSVIEKVNDEFSAVFNRSYGNGLVEEFKTEDAEVIIVTLGSVAGTIKDVIDERGDSKVGLLRIKSFRPLPEDEIRRALKGAKVVGVIEKDVSIGLGKGALASEVRDVMYGSGDSKILSFIAGLGGRDITLDSVRGVIDTCEKALSEDVETVHWVDLKTE